MSSPYGAYTYAPPAAPKPGVIPLRPMGIGEILDGAIQSVRRNPAIMLGLTAIVVTITQLLAFAATWSFVQDVNALDPATASGDDFLAAYGGLATGSIPAWFIGSIAQTILVGLLTVVIGRAVLGQQTSLAGAWQQFRPRLLPLIGLSILVTFATWGLLALSVGLVVLLAATVSPLLLVLGPVAVLPAVFLYVKWWVAGPALILEKANILRAMSRSYSLTAGAWWRTFFIIALTLLLTTVISSVVAAPFQILGLGGAVLTSGSAETLQIGFWSLFVQTIGQIVGLTITYPFTAGVTALVYIDRRMRAEGLDLELARAATPPTR